MTLRELALLNAVPDETIRPVFNRCLLDNRVPCFVHALPWWATRGDTVSIHEAKRRSDSAARSPLTNSRDGWRYTALASQPYLAVARGDTAAAIPLFASLPDSVIGGVLAYKLSQAQLLEARGMNRAAAAVLDYEFRPENGLSGLWMLERGRVNERLGNRAKAIDAYAFVVNVWLRADSELQPFVDEARAGLRKLGAERN
jgi:hypothetical protein